LGVVKIDVDKAELEWVNTNLSSLESIKGLLRYGKRFKYDIVYKKMFCFDMYAKENNHEILCLYIWLDSLIKKCKFTQKQQNILYWHYLEGVSKRAVAHGFVVKQSEDWIGKVTFLDVGALVYQLINTPCRNV